MSAYVLTQKQINLLTQATNYVLELNREYPASYHLHNDTIKLLSKYTGDLHSIYKALFITNIKAVNGRYGDNASTFPRYQQIDRWDPDFCGRNIELLKTACETYSTFIYQIEEEPVFNSNAFLAFMDIKKTLSDITINEIIYN